MLHIVVPRRHPVLEITLVNIRHRPQVEKELVPIRRAKVEGAERARGRAGAADAGARGAAAQQGGTCPHDIADLRKSATQTPHAAAYGKRAAEARPRVDGYATGGTRG